MTIYDWTLPMFAKVKTEKKTNTFLLRLEFDINGFFCLTFLYLLIA